MQCSDHMWRLFIRRKVMREFPGAPTLRPLLRLPGAVLGLVEEKRPCMPPGPSQEKKGIRIQKL